jgi:hypothetical protein
MAKAAAEALDRIENLERFSSSRATAMPYARPPWRWAIAATSWRFSRRWRIGAWPSKMTASSS